MQQSVASIIEIVALVFAVPTMHEVGDRSPLRDKTEKPAIRSAGGIPTRTAIDPSKIVVTHDARRYAERVAENGRLGIYNAQKEQFEDALSLLPAGEREKLRDTLEALRFVDYTDVASDTMAAFMSRGEIKITDCNIQYRYHPRRSKNGDAFPNFHRAGQFLKSTDEPPSVERLLKVHSLTMDREIDNIDGQYVGNLRDYAVSGEQLDPGITQTEVRRISKNVYLHFEVAAEAPEGADPNLFYGDIVYPEPSSIKQEALNRIEESHSSISRAVSKYQQLSEEAQEKVSARDLADLTRKLIRALLEERYEFFNGAIKEIGALDTAVKVEKYINTVADHYRDIISIHPSVDGNGRTIRHECLFDPLDQAGISRPRLSDPNRDVLYSPSGWRKEVMKAVISTDRLYADVSRRIREGLPIENSPELIFADPLRSFGVVRTFQGKNQTESKGNGLIRADEKQFAAFVCARFEKDTELSEKFEEFPLEVVGALRSEYKDFAKKHSPISARKKGHEEFVSIQMVDMDFYDTFGVIEAHNAEKWQNKIDRWYRPEMIWRGMSDEDYETSEDELLSIFSSLASGYGLSVNLLNHWDENVEHEKFADWARLEFDRYNHDLTSGELYKMATDHSRGIGDYDTSYGISTSRNWGFAKKYALGGGKLGEAIIDLLKVQEQVQSRVIIGAACARKDVDLMRLSAADSRYKNKYNKQNEVMAIGGIDPDSIMIVQALDRRGNVQRSYVRDIEAPTRIWTVSGKFDPTTDNFSSLPKERVLDLHTL